MINFEFEIENLGTQDMMFSKLYIQNYVSQDAVYDVGDPGASGSNLTYSGGAQINAGATYATTFTANFTGALEAYPYLIVRLFYSDGECNSANNEMIVCTRPDIALISGSITHLTSTTFNYNFTIKNVGADTVFFNKFLLQNWVSVDDVYGAGDAAGGGTTLSGKPYLLANEVYSSTFSGNNASLSSYSYLIAQAYSQTETGV